MIHAAIMGSIERFLSILIEHYAGDFPTWLAPVQARVLAVSEKFEDYAKKVLQILKNDGVRAELSESNKSLGKRIREAELEKIPYVIVVGEKEKTSGTVSVRKRHKDTMLVEPVDKFSRRLVQEITDRV